MYNIIGLHVHVYIIADMYCIRVDSHEYLLMGTHYSLHYKMPHLRDDFRLTKSVAKVSRPSLRDLLSDLLS